MPTIFDRWPNGAPTFRTKYADGEIERIVTRGDGDTALGQSLIREMTVNFYWKLPPLRPDGMKVSFTGNRADATNVDINLGVAQVFRNAQRPGLAEAKYLTLFVNDIPAAEVGAQRVVARRDEFEAPSGLNYVDLTIENIKPVYDIERENIAGFTADYRDTWGTGRDSVFNEQQPGVMFNVWDRESARYRLLGQRINRFDDSLWHRNERTIFGSTSFSADQRMGQYHDCLIQWYELGRYSYDERNQLMPLGAFQPPLNQTLLLYRQNVDVTFYNARANKRAIFAPAQDSDGGLLAAKQIAQRGAFLEL